MNSHDKEFRQDGRDSEDQAEMDSEDEERDDNWETSYNANSRRFFFDEEVESAFRTLAKNLRLACTIPEVQPRVIRELSKALHCLERLPACTAGFEVELLFMPAPDSDNSDTNVLTLGDGWIRLHHSGYQSGPLGGDCTYWEYFVIEADDWVREPWSIADLVRGFAAQVVEDAANLHISDNSCEPNW